MRRSMLFLPGNNPNMLINGNAALLPDIPDFLQNKGQITGNSSRKP